MELVHGKYFSITEPKDVNTVIYQINKTEKEYLKQYPRYTIERLECSVQKNENTSKKTFFLNGDKEETLLLLSFGKEKVVANIGIYINDEVRISKSPIPMKFNTLYSEKDEYKEINYTPNLKRPIAIIDPETTEEIKPVLYFDEEKNEVVGKCKLKPYKSYFAFEIG